MVEARMVEARMVVVDATNPLTAEFGGKQVQEWSRLLKAAADSRILISKSCFPPQPTHAGQIVISIR
jgi:hypothetical protein